MEIEPVFKIFAELMDERLSKDVFTTEDSVRYTFFLALIEAKFCKHTDIILEKPHPTIEKAEVDLFIQERDNRLSYAFEFKYYREIPSENVSARTQKAGGVFKDLLRLAHIPKHKASQRIFVFMTSKEMANHFLNPTNNLLWFFELPETQSHELTPDFILGKADTFRHEVGNQLPIACQITNILRRNLRNNHYLRIYQIHNANRE